MKIYADKCELSLKKNKVSNKKGTTQISLLSITPMNCDLGTCETLDLQNIP